ncbi:MAG: zinc-regulated TonB-dependent outer membrane receptor [Myxococcaceae bacterium]
MSSRLLRGLVASLSLISFTAVAQSPPADAQQQPSDADLQDIQKALEKDQAANSGKKDQQQGAVQQPSPEPEQQQTTAQTVISGIQSMNPDISVILDVAGAYFSDPAPLQQGGHDPTHNGFNLQQLELSFNRSVDPYFRFDSNLVFGPDGFELEEAYATTLDLPYRLQARAGEFLTAFGRINQTHPHSWDFVDQPFIMSRYFGGDGNRNLGAELSWLSPLPWYVELVGSATQANGESTARSFFGPDDDARVRHFSDFQYTAALKQFFDVTDDLSLLWGLSTAQGPTPTGHAQLYGTDIYLKYRPLTGEGWTTVSLQAEAIYRIRDANLGTPETPANFRLHDYGGYAQLFYRFEKRWGVAGRFDYGSATRFSNGKVTADELDPEWTDARERYSANLTFWPTEFSRLRLQASMDRPQWREQPVFAAFLALEVVVGAHGAHKF